MKNNPFPLHPILIVDDEASVIESLSDVLQAAGINNLIACQDSREVMNRLQRSDIEAILLDLAMPHLSGQELLEQIHRDFPTIPVIIITAANEVQTAVECMKAGAFDFMVKAVDPNRLVNGVRLAIENRELKREYSELRSRFLKDELSHPEAFSQIITRNRKMKSIFLYIESVANTNEPVLVTGETGAGKELVARAIHDAGNKTGRFVEVNAAGLDDEMFSDTLYGHRKGAFTPAYESRSGLVQQSSGGTLFLDEIGDLSAHSQVKLLKLLDTGEYYPLGSDLPLRSDARFVLATNRDLEDLMAENKFRKDLYYRLSTHEIRVPPLRERREDLPLLLDYFAKQAAAEFSKKQYLVPAELVTRLSAYHFPGNIRELRKMIFDAVAVAEPSATSLPLDKFLESADRGTRRAAAEQSASAIAFPEILPTIEQARQLLTEEALRRAEGNQSVAASLLGISHQALNKWLHRNKD